MNHRTHLMSLAIAAILQLAPPKSLPQSVLPDTPAGKQVAAYVSAFNADENEMREFIRTHWTPDALKSVPLEPRIERYKQMRRDLGTLRLHRVLNSTETSISTVMRSEKNEWLEVRFGFDDTPQRAVAWISIQQIDDPDQPPVPPATSVEDMLSRTASYFDSLAAIDQFSGVVSIARNDLILFTHAYGYLDREKRVPNLTVTKFKGDGRNSNGMARRSR